MINEEIIIKEDINESNVMPASVPFNKTKYLFYDGTGIPFLLSAGSVEGTLHYITNFDPDVQFYAEKIYGVVNWVSGFDSLSITNTNETYGHLYSTPSCPPRKMTTWNIDKSAGEQGQYYYEATVSYSLVIDIIPIYYWRSKHVTLP